MYYNNKISENIFTRSHRTLMLGTVLLGCLLFILAIIIFFYPALIAYSIAAIILFVGLSFLSIGWKFWRFRNTIIKLDKIEDEPYHYRSPVTSRTYFTYYRW